VVINHLGIRDPERLAKAEAALVGRRFADLLQVGAPGPIGSDWHRGVHKALFGDLYPFAGEYRTTHISKLGEAPYASPAYLEHNAVDVYAAIHGKNELRDLSPREFRHAVAKVMADLHVLHPFREGNTRTLQIATAEIAVRAGHRLEWQHANPREIRAAGTHAAFGNTLPYERILSDIMPSLRRQSFVDHAILVMSGTKSSTLTSAIREERTRPGSSLSGVVLAATEHYVAITASARTFAVVERSKLSNPVLPGERVKAIVESERITIAIVNRGRGRSL